MEQADLAPDEEGVEGVPGGVPRHVPAHEVAVAGARVVGALAEDRVGDVAGVQVGQLGDLGGDPGAAVGPTRLADSSFMPVPLLVFSVRSFGEPFDRAESPVPLGGELGHSPGGLVQAVGLYLVENFPALLAPADQPGPFEHDQVLGDGLAGERHPSGQPAGAYLTVADQEVEDVAARRLGDGRPQLVIRLRVQHRR